MMTLAIFMVALAAAPVEPYLACSCGCGVVNDADRQTICFATQAELDEAIAKDRAWKTNPQCATMGASFGEYYKLCDPAQNSQ